MFSAMNWKEKWCVLFHRKMSVIRKMGFSWHIKCDKCGCEYGINHDVRIVLPWREVKEFYQTIDDMIDQAKRTPNVRKNHPYT